MSKCFTLLCSVTVSLVGATTTGEATTLAITTAEVATTMTAGVATTVASNMNPATTVAAAVGAVTTTAAAAGAATTATDTTTTATMVTTVTFTTTSFPPNTQKITGSVTLNAPSCPAAKSLAQQPLCIGVVGAMMGSPTPAPVQCTMSTPGCIRRLSSARQLFTPSVLLAYVAILPNAEAADVQRAISSATPSSVLTLLTATLAGTSLANVTFTVANISIPEITSSLTQPPSGSNNNPLTKEPQGAIMASAAVCSQAAAAFFSSLLVGLLL